MTKNKKIEIPSVLAFEKKIIPSDGYMYGTSWNRRHNENEITPLKLKEKSVRGTISHRLTGTQNSKLDAQIENPNLQTVDTCSLGVNQDTLKLKFTLKILGGMEQPSACNNSIFSEECAKKVQEYIKKYKCSELAFRYVHNLICTRFLWRNRVGAEKIEVRIKILNLSDFNDKLTESWMTFDSQKIEINDFKSNTESNEIKTLAQKIADTFSHTGNFLLLEVEAYALLGKKQEVYPSEELVLDKEKSQKGSKSKILYSVDDIAAIHSQKIGNAIRTIDTWYPEYNKTNEPIAIEPYGAVTNLGKAYRDPKDKHDFYNLFDGWILNTKELSKEEQHYIIAVLIRGGVFGKTGDKKSKGEA